MRYSIEGFSQIEAVKFRRTEIVNRKNPKTGIYEEKETVVTLDCTDLVILRWFVDFWPNMMKVEISGVQYAWLSYKDAIEDMPLLGVKKAAFALRLKKMVDFGILSHKTVKSGGTFSYYGFGPEYARLVDSNRAKQNSDPAQNFVEGVHNKLDTPIQNIGDQIDPNTKDPSTKDNPKKERKKPRTFDAIIAERTENQELREALGEFIRMRERIKKPLTDYALKMRLDKLWKLGSTDAERISIVRQSIGACWQDFYPLKGEDKRQRPAQLSQEARHDLGFDDRKVTDTVKGEGYEEVWY